MPLGDIGQVPSSTVYQGFIKRALVTGVTTSTWDARAGGQSQTEFKGTQQQVTALAVDAQIAGFAYSIRGGHVWTLTVTFPFDIIVNDGNPPPTPINFWELTYTIIDRDVLECTDRKFVGALSRATKKRIEYALKLPIGEVSLTADNDAANLINATVAYDLKLIGVGGKATPIPTLKRTAIIPNDFDLNTLAGWNNPQRYDLRVMTTDQLFRTYDVGNPLGRIPDTILSRVPISLNVYDVYQNSFAERTGFVTSMDGVVTYIGWLQFPVDTQQISINKSQVNQTWVFNQWSAGTYGLYDSAFDGFGPNPTQAIQGQAIGNLVGPQKF